MQKYSLSWTLCRPSNPINVGLTIMCKTTKFAGVVGNLFTGIDLVHDIGLKI